MKKYDLCTGDIVLSTKGSYGIVLIGTNGDDQIKWYSNNGGQVITNIILVIKQLQNIMQQKIMDLNVSMKS